MLAVTSAYQLPCIKVNLPKVINRYGVVPIFEDKFCLIVLSYSHDFRRFIRGQYTVHEFDELMTQLTNDEIDIVNRLLSLQIDIALEQYQELYESAYISNVGFNNRNDRFRMIYERNNHITFPYYNREKIFFPGGKREYNESASETGLRELREETGITDYTLTPYTFDHVEVTRDCMKIITHYQIVILNSKPQNVSNKEVKELIITSELPSHYNEIKNTILEIKDKVYLNNQ